MTGFRESYSQNSPHRTASSGAAPAGAALQTPLKAAPAFSFDGDDLTDLPPFERAAGNRFVQGGEAAYRMAHNHEIAGASPAPATSATTCEPSMGREGMPSGLLPLPQAPP